MKEKIVQVAKFIMSMAVALSIAAAGWYGITYIPHMDMLAGKSKEVVMFAMGAFVFLIVLVLVLIFKAINFEIPALAGAFLGVSACGYWVHQLSYRITALQGIIPHSIPPEIIPYLHTGVIVIVPAIMAAIILHMKK